jgi:hypothetical protein
MQLNADGAFYRSGRPWVATAQARTTCDCRRADPLAVKALPEQVVIDSADVLQTSAVPKVEPLHAAPKSAATRRDLGHM